MSACSKLAGLTRFTSAGPAVKTLFGRHAAFGAGVASTSGWSRRCLSTATAAAAGNRTSGGIHYEVHGEAHPEGKAPVVMAHGLMGSGTNFQSIAKAIHKQTKRQVVVYDARNHGVSFHSDTMTYQDMSDDLCDLVQGQLKVESGAVLLGHSMGGRTVMFTALTRPEMVDQLIVVDVSPCNVDFTTMDSTEWNMSHFFHAMKAVAFIQPSDDDAKWSISKARRDADAQLAHRIKDPGLRQWLLMNMVQDPVTKRVHWRHNMDVIHRAFETDVRTFPPFDPAVTFDKQTVFIGGALSDYLPVSDHPEILERFPRATFEYVEGAGHWVHSQKPAQFIELVLKHLQLQQ